MSGSQAHPFDRLTPDFILDALEDIGLRGDGRLLPLNSYENRVYQVGMEQADSLIVKFYRPERWSMAALQEEHAFVAELRDAELPVVAPVRVAGQSLFEHGGFYFAVYPRQGGHWPELNQSADRQQVGRLLGRLHLIGQRYFFSARPRLSIKNWAIDSRRYLLEQDWIPPHLLSAYRSVSRDLIELMQSGWDELNHVRLFRLHGDCHLGNLLWHPNTGLHFVDFDDCLTGPAIQDLWMLVSGSRQDQKQQLGELLSGYTQFADFDYSELRLIEILRALRLMHYAAWLARRWDDPAFPRAFPWFAEPKFWEQHVLDLREQLSVIQEPAFDL